MINNWSEKRVYSCDVFSMMGTKKRSVRVAEVITKNKTYSVRNHADNERTEKQRDVIINNPRV